MPFIHLNHNIPKIWTERHTFFIASSNLNIQLMYMIQLITMKLSFKASKLTNKRIYIHTDYHFNHIRKRLKLCQKQMHILTIFILKNSRWWIEPFCLRQASKYFIENQLTSSPYLVNAIIKIRA